MSLTECHVKNWIPARQAQVVRKGLIVNCYNASSKSLLVAKWTVKSSPNASKNGNFPRRRSEDQYTRLGNGPRGTTLHPFWKKHRHLILNCKAKFAAAELDVSEGRFLPQ